MLKTLKFWAKSKRHSDTEAAVHDATSTDPWGPSGTEMDKIAQLTCNYENFLEIREMLVARLNNEGKNWRQVYKSLVVIDYILHHGPEYANIYFKYNFHSIRVLEKFQYFDEYGKDQGQKVRDKAVNIANLLLDVGRLRTERR
ncbi:epsin 2-like protein, partial [Mycena olivaceomarginata]